VDRGQQTNGDFKLTSYRYTQKGKVVLDVVAAEVKPGTAFFELSLAAGLTRNAGGVLAPGVPKATAPADLKR
jgi:hypothetical protein